MTNLEIFLCGFGGSLATEIITIAHFYEASTIKLPERYSHFFYYVIRLIIALIGGWLAVVYEIDKAIVAINIGATAPLILQSISKKPII